jgi:hypothetical protein
LAALASHSEVNSGRANARNFRRRGAILARSIMENTMRKLIVLAQMSAVTILALLAASSLGRATTDAPWCVIFGGAQGAIEDCTIRTFEECRQEMIGGNRGSCFPNPRYRTDWQSRSPRHSSARHRG